MLRKSLGLLLVSMLWVTGYGQGTVTAVVSTFAGSGQQGSANGPGGSATFHFPTGAAVDASGNVYIAEYGNNLIRKIDPTGMVTTLAGSGQATAVDGTGTAASFYSPAGVAVDTSGYVYVADLYNNKIRKISPAGVVTTLAGTGYMGSTDGAGTAATFVNPTGVAVDASGYVYVADNGNSKIRKVSPAGVVTTLAGSGTAGWLDGTGTAAVFAYPTDLAVDTSGYVYVMDGSYTIRKVSPAGVVTTLAGTAGNVGATDGKGTAASFDQPFGIAVDTSGNLYVADTGNNEIRTVSPAGVVTTLAGLGANFPGSTDGPASVATLSYPYGVAADMSGNLYVPEVGDNKIRKITVTRSQQQPAITWAAPAAITYGTALSASQLDATTSVPGNLVYTPAAGTVLNAGTQTLSVTFTPNDTTTYATVTKTQSLVVNQAVPVLEWYAPAAITSGSALSATQLNAEASVPGTFVYTPAAGTVPSAGSQTLSVTFTPSDTTDYTMATATQTLTVVSANYTAFLDNLFPLVLARQIDPGALAAYVSVMSNGETRSQVYGSLIGSTEYGAWQIEPAIRLYYAALARPPDYGGLQNWSNALHAGVLTLDGAGDQFASSAEFLQDYGNLDNTGYVQQLYRNVLGREADPAGLADWVNQLNSGATRGTILIGFSESPEFQADMANQVEIVRLYYLLLQRMPTAPELQSWLAFLNGDDQTDTLLAQGNLAGISASTYVQTVFQGFLCRNVDAGALNTFTSGLAAGTVTHGSLVDTLMSSTEFSQYVGPVSRLYLAAFNRVPDQPGLINWVTYLQANTLSAVGDTFAASQEFTNHYGSLSDSDYVNQLYLNVLGRTADSGGLTYWTGLLSSGTTRGQVLIGFSQSPEGINLFAPTLRTFLSYYAFLGATPTQQDLDYWKNYLNTLTDQFRQSFLEGPSFGN